MTTGRHGGWVRVWGRQTGQADLNEREDRSVRGHGVPLWFEREAPQPLEEMLEPGRIFQLLAHMPQSRAPYCLILAIIWLWPEIGPTIVLALTFSIALSFVSLFARG